jgi:hypothetical protein
VSLILRGWKLRCTAGFLDARHSANACDTGSDWEHCDSPCQAEPGDTQFDDLERRDPLHAGRSGYRCGRIALNLGLQAAAKTPSQPEPTIRARFGAVMLGLHPLRVAPALRPAQPHRVKSTEGEPLIGYCPWCGSDAETLGSPCYSRIADWLDIEIACRSSRSWLASRRLKLVSSRARDESCRERRSRMV